MVAGGGDDDIALGMIGVSEGNGHPYSFSSIINGYSDEGLANAGWDVIYDYVSAKDPSEIGFENVTITHAWTQHPEETERLCAAAEIPHAVTEPEEMHGMVDGVIIARDDYETHYELAMPFLEAGTPVFLDKPLSLDPAEVRAFRPYLEQGRFMSCSGMRFARELDVPRTQLDRYGEVTLIRGAVLNDWAHYGVHMLDAMLELVEQRPVAVTAHRATHDSVTIELDDGTLLQVDALGEVPMTFAIDIYGSTRTSSHELRDNFTAFRRTLWRFVEMVRDEVPPIDPEATLDVMRVLIAGHRSRLEHQRISLDEVNL
ncbi:Gfo/Idh/MocA family protein [Natrialbaceae archaeon A-CW1-1]